MQTIARLYRQGQKDKTVVVIHIITTGTIDEYVMRAISKKGKVQDLLIEAVKAKIGGKC
jgi:SNF2 family DNA or RNA helicase